MSYVWLNPQSDIAKMFFTRIFQNISRLFDYTTDQKSR